MTLSELLNGIKIIKSNVFVDTKILGITNDSRKVEKGYLFVAVNGVKRNGNKYIGEACRNGAIAIITDDVAVCDNQVPYLLVESSRRALTAIWSNYYGNPGKNIKTVALTGTNGKTTSAYYLYNILRSANKSCALISTIECLINDEKVEYYGGSVSDIHAAMTTPDPEFLYSLYNIMKKKGVEFAVIEASSHALEQYRLDELKIEIGAFTNLSREHLDYHSSMEEYFKAKKKLFELCHFCVTNADDYYGKIIYDEYTEKTVRISTEANVEFQITEITPKQFGIAYLLACNEEKIGIETKILGEYNVYNSALAAACAKVLGIDSVHIKKGIENTTGIIGRLERYKDKEIYIDYAHTPRAMERVISAFNEIKGGKRLIVLFGCGGERDKGKRSEMGRIASSLADLTVITSDNPRNENPNEIINDILKGIEKEKEFMVIPNRRDAISVIASNLKKDEILLLLGKGHETYEINEKGKVHFDEREVLDRVFLGG